MRCDINTTVGELKAEAIGLCKRKKWGDENGIQRPNNVATALIVEAMELLEHFDGANDAEVLARISEPDELTEIAEELADVIIYSLQLMTAIKCDVSARLSHDFSDALTPISRLREYVGKCRVNAVKQAVHFAVNARYLVEEIQWMTTDEADELVAGGLDEKCEAMRGAMAVMFRELLLLANALDADISEAVMRKLGIVEKRKY